MVRSEDKQFIGLMKGLAEVFDSGNTISVLRVEIYWRALESYTLEQVNRAISELIKTRVFPSLPKPAEIIAAIEGNVEDRALTSWLEVLNAVKHIGTYQSVKFSNPVIHSVIEGMDGWLALGNTPNKELKWKQKEFIALFLTLSKGSSGRDHPVHLPGRIELSNSAYPDHIPKPIMIGQNGAVKEIENKKEGKEGKDVSKSDGN